MQEAYQLKIVPN